MKLHFFLGARSYYNLLATVVVSDQVMHKVLFLSFVDFRQIQIERLLLMFD